MAVHLVQQLAAQCLSRCPGILVYLTRLVSFDFTMAAVVFFVVLFSTLNFLTALIFKIAINSLSCHSVAVVIGLIILYSGHVSVTHGTFLTAVVWQICPFLPFVKSLSHITVIYCLLLAMWLLI